MMQLKEDFNKSGQGLNISRQCIFNGKVTVEAPVQFGGGVFGGVQTYIGAFSYIASGAMIKGIKAIGRFCSIANDFSAGYGNHNIHSISTHPMFEGFTSEWTEEYSKIFQNSKWIDNNKEASNKILGNKRNMSSIGNDVWIGKDVFLCNGVHIGDGAVIGAKSVVTKDIPDYAIAAGAPAKVIGYRFSFRQIAMLQEIKWWEYGPDILADLDINNIDECLEHIKKRIDEGFSRYVSHFLVVDGKSNKITIEESK